MKTETPITDAAVSGTWDPNDREIRTVPAAVARKLETERALLRTALVGMVGADGSDLDILERRMISSKNRTAIAALKATR